MRKQAVWTERSLNRVRRHCSVDAPKRKEAINPTAAMDKNRVRQQIRLEYDIGRLICDVRGANSSRGKVGIETMDRHRGRHLPTYVRTYVPTYRPETPREDVKESSPLDRTSQKEIVDPPKD